MSVSGRGGTSAKNSKMNKNEAKDELAEAIAGAKGQ